MLSIRHLLLFLFFLTPFIAGCIQVQTPGEPVDQAPVMSSPQAPTQVVCAPSSVPQNITCPSVNPVAPVTIIYSACPWAENASHSAYGCQIVNYSGGAQGCFPDYGYYPSVLPQDALSRSMSPTSLSITLSKADGHDYNVFSLPCTGSMQPMMGCGNTIVTQQLLPSDTVNIGDVVGYDSGILNRGLLHQVVAKNGSCFIVKGLALSQPDGCIDRSMITERLVGIIYTR